MFQSELKHQRKLVRSLKKKSLWSRTLEEVYFHSMNCSSFSSLIVEFSISPCLLL